MKISAKGRYALAAMLHMAASHGNGETFTVISVSEKLGTSKIYLEQIFSLLKRGGLLNSIKGSQGGYYLAKEPCQITMADILFAAEQSLFEKTKAVISDKVPEIDKAINQSVFDVLDEKIKETLEAITLENLALDVEKHKSDGKMMFYI